MLTCVPAPTAVAAGVIVQEPAERVPVAIVVPALPPSLSVTVPVGVEPETEMSKDNESP